MHRTRVQFDDNGQKNGYIPVGHAPPAAPVVSTSFRACPDSDKNTHLTGVSAMSRTSQATGLKLQLHYSLSLPAVVSSSLVLLASDHRGTSRNPVIHLALALLRQEMKGPRLDRASTSPLVWHDRSLRGITPDCKTKLGRYGYHVSWRRSYKPDKLTRES